MKYFKPLEKNEIQNKFIQLGAGNPLRRNIGEAVITVRGTGSIHAFGSINHFYLINEMTIPGSSTWYVGFGKDKRVTCTSI